MRIAIIKKIFIVIMIILLISSCSKDYYNSSVNKFIDNKEDINIICEYIKNSGYEDVHINVALWYESPEIFTNNGMNVIDDKKVTDSIENLSKAKYSIIRKENNAIYFQSYSTKDWGCGVLYSIDGETPINQYITQIDKLSEKDWYYYEER